MYEVHLRSRDKVVSIVTHYTLGASLFEPWWGWDFPQPSRSGPKVHSASCKMGTGPFPGGKAAGA